MKIISVERADADALADSFFEDLLDWGAVPQRTAPLPEGWRGAYQDQLNQVVAIFRRAYAEDTKADRESLAAFRLVEKEARGFITVLAANPALALKAADSEWPEGYALNRYRGLDSSWESLKALRKRASVEHAAESEREPGKTAVKDPLRSTDDTAVTAHQLAFHASVTDKAVRDRLRDCPSVTGRGGEKQWRYCDVVESLRSWCEGEDASKRMKNKGIEWPQLAKNLKSPKDGSKKK